MEIITKVEPEQKKMGEREREISNDATRFVADAVCRIYGNQKLQSRYPVGSARPERPSSLFSLYAFTTLSSSNGYYHITPLYIARYGRQTPSLRRDYSYSSSSGCSYNNHNHNVHNLNMYIPFFYSLSVGLTILYKWLNVTLGKQMYKYKRLLQRFVEMPHKRETAKSAGPYLTHQNNLGDLHTAKRHALYTFELL